MFDMNSSISVYDEALCEALKYESTRQEDHVELIASENYASPRVLEAQGSVLTNKYAEGYPGKRYYGGCEHVDVVEQLAIDRAKQLFGAEYANVQPHAGSQANAAAYLALMEAGDTVLLSAGVLKTITSPLCGLLEKILFLKIGGLNGNECLLYPYEYFVTKSLSPTNKPGSMDEDGI